MNEEDFCILPTVNRAAAIVIPKQAMLDWLNTTPAKLDPSYTIEVMQAENTSVFLLSEFEDQADVLAWFKKDCKDALTELLMGWCTDIECWPELNWKTFEKFFEVRIETLVFDMGDGKVLHDDIDEDDLDDEDEESEDE